ncbi:peroxiredoxin-like family protein [Parafilimonas sp.]|uniref:peroxiredoxin-like family protein n=1 Tax=Parafilimonas sp. TaxID=1969739 RepID=UPI003F7F522B
MKPTTKLSFKFIAVVLLSACSIQMVRGQEAIQSTEAAAMNAGQMSYMVPQKPEDISPLLNGEKIPMATLTDVMGKSFDLNKAVAEKPTILIIYRGGWCPYCSKQLSGLQQAAPELENLGYQLIAISTDAPEGLTRSATKEKLSYTLLSDADLNLSKQLGIAYKAPKGYWEMLPKTTGGKDSDLLLPVPSVFILDKTGTIHFEYINPDFTQRLNPELLKTVAASLQKDLN